jgi:vitamin B12 transporter
MRKILIILIVYNVCFNSISAVYSQAKDLPNTYFSTDSSGSADAEKIYRLSEIIISATKTRTPSIEIPSSVSVIDSAEIAESNKTNLLDLLKDEYGLIVSQSGGPGQLAQVYMRGANPDQVLVEINGVRLNMPDDPGSSYDFSSIPLDNVERVEILRGPQSTLYGSDATAGVINVITRSGSGEPDYFATLEGGSMNSYKGLIGAEGEEGAASYSVTLSKAKSDGIPAADQKFGNSVRDGYEDYNLSSSIGLRIDPEVKLNLFAGFNAGKVGLPQHGGPLGDDPTYFGNHQQGAYRMEADINSFGGVWEQRAGVSFMRDLRRYSYDSTANNPASSRSYYSGDFYQADWQNNLKFIPGNLLTLGLEADKQTSSSIYSYISSLYGSFSSLLPLVSISNLSAYFQDQIDISKLIHDSRNKAYTVIGVRYDDYSNFGSAVTFRVGQTYLIEHTGTKLKAVYGTGFKAPTLVDLYDPVYGNKNLKSERSAGWEAGLEQFMFNYTSSIGVTYFSNDFSNMFGYDSNYVSVNIGKARTRGVELSLMMRTRDSFETIVNYTYTEATDKTPGANYNRPLIRRPKNSASVVLNYKFSSRFNVNADFVYVGKREDINFSVYPSTRVQLAPYDLLNVSLSYKLSEVVRFYGRIENLFDEKYEDVYGYGTPGRAGYVGITLNVR